MLLFNNTIAQKTLDNPMDQCIMGCVVNERYVMFSLDTADTDVVVPEVETTEAYVRWLLEFTAWQDASCEFDN